MTWTLAFYDALAESESAMQAMGDDKLKAIAPELVTKVRSNVSIDWTLRESARARMRVLVKRILNKHGYPPDLEAETTKLALDQAAALYDGWEAGGEKASVWTRFSPRSDFGACGSLWA